MFINETEIGTTTKVSRPSVSEAGNEICADGMEIQVVASQSLCRLIYATHNMIVQGWKPEGGVVVAPREVGCYNKCIGKADLLHVSCNYEQVMVRQSRSTPVECSEKMPAAELPIPPCPKCGCSSVSMEHMGDSPARRLWRSFQDPPIGENMMTLRCPRCEYFWYVPSLDAQTKDAPQ